MKLFFSSKKKPAVQQQLPAQPTPSLTPEELNARVQTALREIGIAIPTSRPPANNNYERENSSESVQSEAPKKALRNG